MKHVVVVYEGAADAPQRELEGRTPLQVARCPNAARLAREGRAGWLKAPAREEDHRSEVLLALLCGCSHPEALQLHRGPVEAAALEEDLRGYTHAFRANLVTLDGGQLRESRVGRLSLEETRLLTASVQDAFDPQQVRLLTAAPARVMVLVRSDQEILAPGLHPDLAEGDVELYLPQGKRGELVRRMLEASGRALQKATINDVRVDLGENPATHLWLWGGGRFYQPGHRAGLVLSNSQLGRGLARLLGMGWHPLRDPWGEDASSLERNAALFAQSLQEADFLLVHVEAPREAGGYGGAVEKVRLLERVDLVLLGPLMRALEQARPCRVALTADNLLVPSGHEAAGRAPVAVWRDGVDQGGVAHWDEPSCREGALGALAPEDLYSITMGEN